MLSVVIAVLLIVVFFKLPSWCFRFLNDRMNDGKEDLRK